MKLIRISPSPDVHASFERAMASLARHPEHIHGDGVYQYLPPTRRYVLTGQDARNGDLSRLCAVGWQYLVSDHGGFAVVDLSDDIPETYSSVRRGDFATRYIEVLNWLATLDEGAGAEIKLIAFEVPEYGTSVLMLSADEHVRLFPVSMRGALCPVNEVDKSTFFAGQVSSSFIQRLGDYTGPGI